MNPLIVLENSILIFYNCIPYYHLFNVLNVLLQEIKSLGGAKKQPYYLDL